MKTKSFWRCILKNHDHVIKDILIIGEITSTAEDIKKYLEKYDWECKDEWHVEKATQEYINENDDLGGE